MKRPWPALACLFLVTCGGPAPDPVSVPLPTPPANGLPTVTLAATSCHPRRDQPCTATFTAMASDPDGDALTYIWSGCVSAPGPGDVVRLGTASATCAITQPGTVSATVQVTDAKGGSARATASAVGKNESPRLLFDDDGVLYRHHLGAGQMSGMSGRVVDPDQDGEAMVICREIEVAVSGPCTAGRVHCLGPDVFGPDQHGSDQHGFVFSARWGVTLTGARYGGICVVDLRAHDAWDATTAERVRIDVE